MERTYLNTNECAKYLSRTPKAIRELAFRKAIPYRKPGGRLLFMKEEIDIWIESSEGLSLEDWQSETSR